MKRFKKNTYKRNKVGITKKIQKKNAYRNSVWKIKEKRPHDRTGQK